MAKDLGELQKNFAYEISDSFSKNFNSNSLGLPKLLFFISVILLLEYHYIDSVERP
ncbi:hypothetical protein KA183_12385 [bacterium]|nr:hypothetical protein [bacterium]QQR58087.1 MAG: hypothetical protein IPG59_00960 [Candidatus Melainabacteria bacterium]